MEEMIKSVTSDGTTVATFGLSEEQHKAAVELATENKREVNGFHLEDASLFVDTWLEETSDDEYAEFLNSAKNMNADFFTLNDEIQPLGDVAIY